MPRSEHYGRTGTHVPSLSFHTRLCVALLESQRHAGCWSSMVHRRGSPRRDEYYRRICEFQLDLIPNETFTDRSIGMRLSHCNSRTSPGRLPSYSAAHIRSGSTRRTASSVSRYGLSRANSSRTSPDLINALEHGRPLTEIKGLGFPTGNRGNCDQSPPPSAPRRIARAASASRCRSPTTALPATRCLCFSTYASRGCPYQCTFCLWPQTMYRSTSYRVRSPELGQSRKSRRFRSDSARLSRSTSMTTRSTSSRSVRALQPNGIFQGLRHSSC